MIPIKGLYYVNDYIADGYNNEFLQAVLQEYKITFMDIFMKKIKNIMNIIIYH